MGDSVIDFLHDIYYKYKKFLEVPKGDLFNMEWFGQECYAIISKYHEDLAVFNDDVITYETKENED